MLLGQQCDNNFRTENVPCNHLGDSSSRKRRDMMAYNDEVLTQSSGHLSFATRYNSREKRNNNSSNENDNNNNMPIQKYTRKMEKKEEDGYIIAEVASKHYKAKCFNDIYSWRAIEEEQEKDNQQSNKTR